MKNLTLIFCGLFFMGCASSNDTNVNSGATTYSSRPSAILVNSTPQQTNSIPIPKNSSVKNFTVPTAAPSPMPVDADKKIFAEIKAKAQSDFSEDFVMQKFAYNEQVKAYKYMKTLPNSSIKSKAETDFPDDYIMQKFAYNEQTKAKKEMEK